MDLSVTIRDDDVETLVSWGHIEWREKEQQASALLEQALRSYRAKSDPNAAPRRPRSRRATGGTS